MRVWVLRHARSSWKHAEPADHDRPLTGRCQRAAKAIARYMSAKQIEPELVLCSTARRARETVGPIDPALGRGLVQVEGELYGASARELWPSGAGRPVQGWAGSRISVEARETIASPAMTPTRVTLK